MLLLALLSGAGLLLIALVPSSSALQAAFGIAPRATPSGSAPPPGTPAPSESAVALAQTPSTSLTPSPPPSPKPAPAPRPNTTPVAPPATGLRVRVDGNHLVDGSGKALHLHGVNHSGTEFVCATLGSPGNVGWGIYGGPDDKLSTFQAIASWHANAIRIPLNEDCWLGINGINPAYAGAHYQAAIATEVRLAHQAGLYVILDLHWSAPGATLAKDQATMADADHSPTFWSSVASAYKGDPAVIFDLFNEPHPHDSEVNPNADPYGWSCWINGCLMNGGWQAAGMQSLVSAVRSAGATNPVLVNGNGWANDDARWLALRPNDPANQMIAGNHSYPWSGCLFPACWNRDNFQALANQFPIIFGETGDNRVAPATYMPLEIPFLDQMGVSYLAWTWNPWQDPTAVLITDWNGTPSSGEGAWYRAHLLATY